MDNVDLKDMTGDQGGDVGQSGDMSYIKEFVDGLDPDELSYLKTCVKGMKSAEQPEEDTMGDFKKAREGERSEPNSQSKAGGDMNSSVNDEGELD